MICSLSAPAFAEDTGLWTGSASLGLDSQKHFLDAGVTQDPDGTASPVGVLSLNGVYGLNDSNHLYALGVLFLDPADTSFRKNFVNEFDVGAGLAHTWYREGCLSISTSAEVQFWVQGDVGTWKDKALVPATTTSISCDVTEVWAISAETKVEWLQNLGNVSGSGLRVYPAVGSTYKLPHDVVLNAKGGLMVPFMGPYGREEPNGFVSESVFWTIPNTPIALFADTLYTVPFSESDGGRDDITVGGGVKFTF